MIFLRSSRIKERIATFFIGKVDERAQFSPQNHKISTKKHISIPSNIILTTSDYDYNYSQTPRLNLATVITVRNINAVITGKKEYETKKMYDQTKAEW